MQQQEFLDYSPMTLIAKQRFSSLFLTHTPANPSHEVVIKLFDGLPLSTLQEQQDFLDDATRIQTLNHPRILPFFSLGIEQNRPYVISPYLPKGSLRFRLNQSCFPWEKTLELLQQIGEALIYTHEHNLVHANLKPENIFLTPMNDVLLMDFSLQSLYTKMQQMNYRPDDHTIAYMAPETFHGQFSPKSDQYALGCLAFELMTGLVPFHTLAFTNNVHKSMQKTQKIPPSLKNLVPTLPDYVETAIHRALEKQPDNRYKDINAFLHAITAQQTQKTTEPPIILKNSPQKTDTHLIRVLEPQQPVPIHSHSSSPAYPASNKKVSLYMSIIVTLFLMLVSFAIFSPSSNKSKIDNGLRTPIASNLTVPPQQGTRLLQTPYTTLHSNQATSTVVPTPVATIITQTISATQQPLASNQIPTPPPASMVYVYYQLNARWPRGFSTTIRMTNNSTTTINGWTLQFIFSNNEKIVQLWNGQYTQSNHNVTITNASYNAIIAPGQTVTLGFIGSWRYEYDNPTIFLFNSIAVS